LDYKAYAYYTYNGLGAPGLAVSCDVYSSTGFVMTASAVVEIGGGFYSHNHVALVDDDYLFLFKTTASAVDFAQIPTSYSNRHIVPTDVWNDTVRSLTDKSNFSLTTVYDAAKYAASASTVAAEIANVPAEVWTYPIRTLTTTASAVTNTIVTTDSTILCRRGDTFSAAITGLGDLTAYDALYFTVKDYYKKQSDTESTIQVVTRTSGSSVGLLYLNGASASSISTSGSITVINTLDGDITITVDPLATKDLVIGDYLYDVEMVNGYAVSTLAEGTFTVLGDVTRAII
jgi:hypothetical protein